MNEPGPVLEARGVAKSFELPSGRLDVLGGIDLRVAGGETVAILGESGSGKSTLLHILAGLEPFDAGKVLWDGRDLATFRPRQAARERARRIGFVFQSFHLVPELTALQNILLAVRILGPVSPDAGSRARGLLARVGLEGRERQLPVKMSGGERQRVAVARALVNQPGIILADEPTGNLDERTASVVMDLFLDLVREEGVALAMVTHSEAYAERLARQIHLTKGVLVGR